MRMDIRQIFILERDKTLGLPPLLVQASIPHTAGQLLAIESGRPTLLFFEGKLWERMSPLFLYINNKYLQIYKGGENKLN
jgi:hypothetical protein